MKSTLCAAWPARSKTILCAGLLALSIAGAACAQSSPAPAAVKETGDITTSSGLVYRSLLEGTGEMPRANDGVTVHYRGTLADGTEFDSSYKRGEPATFPLNRVIRCWTEGVQRMKVGGKARLTCPAKIAYGERGAPPVIPPNATLTFEIELISIALL